MQGYGALGEFDVPDALRAPVVDAWIGERRRSVVATPTPLGELFFWNEPAVCVPGGSPGTEPAVGFTAFADRVLYDPTGGLLFAQGWAADVSGRVPLQRLGCAEPAMAETARLDYGLPRVDVATQLHADALRPTGWQLAAPLTPDAWCTLRSRGTLTLRAVMTGGRAARHQLDLSTARVLGDLDGAGWTSLARGIAWGAALGRTDRAAACGEGADGRVCECR